MKIKKLLNTRNTIGIWFVGSLFVTVTLIISVITRIEAQKISLTTYQLLVSSIVWINMAVATIAVWNINTLIIIAKDERKKKFILPRIDETDKVA